MSSRPSPNRQDGWCTTCGESPCPYGIDTVAQDLLDDLIQGCDQADALARAVGEVERAGNDFVGADLSRIKLDGVRSCPA